MEPNRTIKWIKDRHE